MRVVAERPGFGWATNGIEYLSERTIGVFISMSRGISVNVGLGSQPRGFHGLERGVSSSCLTLIVCVVMLQVALYSNSTTRNVLHTNRSIITQSRNKQALTSKHHRRRLDDNTPSRSAIASVYFTLARRGAYQRKRTVPCGGEYCPGW